MIGMGGCLFPCVTVADLELGAFSCGNVRPWTGCAVDTVKGTNVGLGWLKKVRRDPFLFTFAFLSHLAFLFRQIFVPWCHFLRLASTTMPQCMQALQSGH